MWTMKGDMEKELPCMKEIRTLEAKTAYQETMSFREAVMEHKDE